MVITLQDEIFTLCFEKCMVRHSDNSLLIADAHFGKSNHFRKAGIGVPHKILFEEAQKLKSVIEKYDVARVVFLGDLFHSERNHAVTLLEEIVTSNNHRKFILVMGNHDIMETSVYASIGIEVVDKIVDGLFVFSHEAVIMEGYYNLYGHIHPGVNLSGKGRQQLRLPCFYFSNTYGILPAFGIFTGLASIKSGAKDSVYVALEGQVIKV